MKNFKLHLLLLLFVAISACNPQQMAEDEAPLEIASAGSINLQNTNNPEPTPDTIEISVHHSRGTDQAYFRSLFQTQLNISDWEACPTNSSIETWTVDFITERELSRVIDDVEQALGGVVIVIQSTGHLQVDDDYATNSDTSVVGNATFYMERICN